MTDSPNESPDLLPIVAIGNPVLRRPAVLVDRGAIATPAFQRLIEQMRATMIEAPGVGLAAPQIGLGIRLAVLEDSSTRWADLDPATLAERERSELPFAVLVNPIVEVLEEAGAVTFYEGCLSVPGYAGAVERARSVRVVALDANGEEFSATYSGWPARIVQHEVDHLDGCIYVDRVETRSLSSVQNLAIWQGRPLGEIANELNFPLSPSQVTTAES